ncbi:MAG TPA: wax ester/triacylglycerol synthase family O-acyltransferase [Mycobacteriales bacterium]|nr:wax ester/triacylglycerol synthase family O-acyltransferase [Mycobacteriales bacterium]
MQQLTGLDAAFLAMETPSVYGHVGSVCVLDPSSAPEPLTIERLVQVIESRLHLIPPFRRRLVTVPFGLDQPYWIEDPDFDIEFHVRELALPAPGDDRQLAEQAARLHARPLDRRRPLWELYLIHGLRDGRVAIYTKVHHAAIDGVSGNDILTALLDLSPEGRPPDDPPPWECDDPPGAVGMLARSAVALAWQPLRAARFSYGLARSLPALATSPARPHLPVIDRLLGRDRNVTLSSTGLRAPATPFNRSIGPHRRWAFRSLPFEPVRMVKNAAGVTVNDVVMALCAGALRRWLAGCDALPASPLIAAVPVSVRTDEQKGTHGNRVSSMIAPLPTNLADPRERLRAAHDAMRAAKDQHGALPADLLADVTQFAMPALAGQAARLSARLRLVERISPFNLIVSNVPGPNIPLYYAGARLLAYLPLSAIADGQGLNITVISYGGQMHFGVIGDRDLVPDLEALADALDAELAELTDALELTTSAGSA